MLSVYTCSQNSQMLTLVYQTQHCEKAGFLKPNWMHTALILEILIWLITFIKCPRTVC